MVKIDDAFTPAVLKDEDRYEGREIDANIAAGELDASRKLDQEIVEVEKILISSAALPKGIEIEWACTHGATHWSISTKIDTIIDGKAKSFFLKEYRDVNAEGMVRAEYESTTALYALAPNNVPQPWAYGPFASDPGRFFYLQSFCDMNDELPDINKFVSVLAKFHQQESPTGKFGFHVTSM